MLNNIVNQPVVKICGLKDCVTINQMDGLPINYVGLVFAPSKREVSVELGKELVTSIHQLDNGYSKKVEAVAVCVNKPVHELVSLVQYTHLDIVQLHGQEDATYIVKVKEKLPEVKIWKALSIKDLSLIQTQQEHLKSYISLLEAVLIDAPGGGTGTVFNWTVIESFKALCELHHCKLFVAGGLHEENVDTLLSAYHIDGVDVSSGVETNGIKDIEKIERFVRKVRKNDTISR